MTFKPAKCPSCGGDLQLPDDKQSVKCMYCGNEIVVRTALNKQLPSIDNLLKLALVAAESSNFKESSDYYTKVLEQDPTNVMAWMGKGLSCGFNLDYETSMACFRQVRELEPQNSQVAEMENRVISVNVKKCLKLAEDAILQGNRIYSENDTSGSDAIKVIQGKSLSKIASESGNPADSAKHSYTSGMSWLSVAADMARKEQISDIEKMVNEIRNNFRISRTFGANLTEKMTDMIVEKIKKVDPRFMPTSTHSGCFVVTATMGSEENIYIETLQQFRDSVLQYTFAGRIFIKNYYHYGPYLANIISKSLLLRKISFITVVLPATWVARKYVKTPPDIRQKLNRFRHGQTVSFMRKLSILLLLFLVGGCSLLPSEKEAKSAIMETLSLCGKPSNDYFSVEVSGMSKQSDDTVIVMAKISVSASFASVFDFPIVSKMNYKFTLKRYNKGWLIEKIEPQNNIDTSVIDIYTFMQLLNTKCNRFAFGSAKGSLDALRIALTVYYGDTNKWPPDLQSLTPKYLNEIPSISIGTHAKTNRIVNLKNCSGTCKDVTNSGGWLYCASPVPNKIGIAIRMNSDELSPEGKKLCEY